VLGGEVRKGRRGVFFFVGWGVGGCRCAPTGSEEGSAGGAGRGEGGAYWRWIGCLFGSGIGPSALSGQGTVVCVTGSLMGGAQLAARGACVSEMMGGHRAEAQALSDTQAECIHVGGWAVSCVGAVRSGGAGCWCYRLVGIR